MSSAGALAAGFGPEAEAVARSVVCDHSRIADLSSQHRGVGECHSNRASYRKHFGARCAPFEREVTALKLLHARPATASATPTLVHVDVVKRVLRTAYIESSVTLRQLCAGGSPALQRALGRCAAVLAAVHQVDHHDAKPSPQPADHPFAFGLSNPTVKLLQVASLGSVELAKVLQMDDTVRDKIARLASSWGPTAFIHNDLKWDNILVYPAEGETEPTQIKLIDWEMAGIGDPSWDVGTVFSEFLAFWVLSIPIVADEPPDAYIDLARYPLEDLQPAISAFWQGYADVMGFNAATARERLITSTRCAGARLIQTAYERTQTMNRLTPQIYLLLQLSLNVLEQPEGAAEQLLGLSL